ETRSSTDMAKGLIIACLRRRPEESVNCKLPAPLRGRVPNPCEPSQAECLGDYTRMGWDVNGVAPFAGEAGIGTWTTGRGCCISSANPGVRPDPGRRRAPGVPEATVSGSTVVLGFMWWLIVGLVAGALARLLVPGRQPMGLVMTLVLGLAGSLLGGLISAALFGYDPQDPGFHAGGLLMSTLGAVILLWGYVAYARRNLPLA